MPDSTTSNYLMIKPEITGSPDTWGNKLNADLDILDNNLDRVDTRAFATVPKDGSEDITALLKYDSGVPVPSDDYHVVNKKYVDDTIKTLLPIFLLIGDCATAQFRKASSNLNCGISLLSALARHMR
jgi:hypothetical protein